MLKVLSPAMDIQTENAETKNASVWAMVRLVFRNKNSITEKCPDVQQS